jgi:hypothetical protein
MFCFRHTDEFWLLGGALGIKVPKCEDNLTNQGTSRTMHCHTQTAMAEWKIDHAGASDTALANKIAEFWGDRYYSTPKFCVIACASAAGTPGASSSIMKVPTSILFHLLFMICFIIFWGVLSQRGVQKHHFERIHIESFLQNK